METIKQGSVESMIVSLDDRLDTITNLASVTSLRYDVETKAGSPKMQNQVPTIQGMKAICLIDTTQGGAWAKGEYHLFVKYDTGSEHPNLGPIRFRVI